MKYNSIFVDSFRRFLTLCRDAYSLFSRKNIRKHRQLRELAAQEERKQQELIRQVEKRKKQIAENAKQIHDQLESKRKTIEGQMDREIRAIQLSTRTSFRAFGPAHNYLRTKSKLYYTWHLNPRASYLNFTALAVFIIASVYFINLLYAPMLQRAYADARTCTWIGTNSTSWDDIGNWDGCSSGVPTAEDYIIFDSSATGDLVMNSDKTVARVTSIDVGNFSQTFNTNGQSLTISETLTWQKGTLSAGSSEITISGNIDLLSSGDGNFTYGTSTLVLAGGNTDMIAKAGLDLYSLKINKSSNSSAATLISNGLNIRGNLSVTKGKLDGSGRTISIIADNSHYYIGDSQGGSATILFTTSTGNQYIDGGGGTSANTVNINKTAGTVYWNGSARNKFITLTNGALNIQSGKLTFPASTDGVAGKLSCAAGKTLTIAGSANKIAMLRSATPGSRWYFENGCGVSTANYVDVKDSNNTSGSIITTNSIDSGNNVGWDFGTSPLSINKWIADTTSNWNSEENWSANHVPTSEERVYFNSDHVGNCNINATASIAGVLIGDYTGTVSQGTSTMYIGAAAFIVGGGTFSGGNAPINFNGSDNNLTIYDGTFTATSGTMTMSAGASFLRYGGTFDSNGGTITFNGAGSPIIDVPASVTFNNLNVSMANSTYYPTIADGDTVTTNGTLNISIGKIRGGTIDLNGTLSGSTSFGGGSTQILINDSQTVNISNNWVLPSINLENGTLNAPSSGTMTFSSEANFTIGNSGTFNHNSGTVVFSGAGHCAIDVPTTKTFNNLTVNLGNNTYYLYLSLGDTLVTSGTLNLAVGKLSSGTIDLNGTLSGSTTFGGGSTQILINDSQTVNISNNWVLPGINLENGTLNAPSSGTMTFAAEADFTIGNNGTFNHNNGTVVFSGAGHCAIDVPTTKTFNNLTVSLLSDAYSLSIASGDTIVVDGTLSLESGKIDAGTLDARGSMNVTAAFAGGTSAMTFAGTNTQTISVTSGGVLPSGGITVNKSSGTITISGTSTIPSNISLTAGTLDFAGGYTYTITENKNITTSANTNLRFTGTAGSLVTLVSSSPGTRWNILDSGKVYANYVDVTDSNNSSGTIYAINSTQSNCVGWDTISTAKTWDGGAGTLVWNTSANWNPDGVPDANDLVTLDVAAIITTSGDINFGSMTLGGTNATTLLLTNNIGIGSDITITGTGTLEQKNKTTQTIMGNVIVNSGGTITHTANTTSEQYKLMLAIKGNLDLQSGGAINANSKGYAPRNGPGYTTSAVSASYGGRGYNVTENKTYGSFENPTDLGSGGFITESGYGNGGGAIIISADGTFSANGTITSNGSSYPCCSQGSGSGGTVNISTGSLEGSGSIAANGGYQEIWGVGGGGGRISFAGVQNDNFSGGINVDSSTINRGQTGTIYLSPSKRSSWTIANGQTYRLGTDTTNNYTFGNITIQSGGILEIDSDPVMNSNNGGAATITASNITIDDGGVLRADGLGFIGEKGPGSSTGGIIGATYGGKGYNNTVANYGSFNNPINLGSGGSGGNQPDTGLNWSNGGGAIILSVSGTVAVNGTLSANGITRETCGGGGGGAGGSINITASALTGSSTGKIEAKGGSAYCNVGAGGGGRISFGGVTTDSYSGSVSVESYYLSDQFPLKGTAGTIYFNEQKRTSWTITNGRTYRLGTDATNNYTFGDINIQSGGVLEVDGDPTLNDNKGGAATINANSITINSGGVLRTDSLGFTYQKGPGYTSNQNSGGSYGGIGGNGGATYGATSSPNPVYLGSGGYGAAGGGAILLNVSGTLTNSGTISSNGIPGSYNDGAGSGGTVNIVANSINSNGGTIRANGGTENTGGGGGGGRVILRAFNSYTGPSTLSVSGGTSSPVGTNGSIFINKSPASAAISSPINGSSNQSQNIAVNFNAIDTTNCSVDGGGTGACTPTTADYLRYKVELADDSGFASNNHSFTQGSDAGGQTVTDNGLTATFSGQNSQSSTAYTSGTTATITISSSTPLIQNHTYYIRISAIDPAGIDSFDGSAHYSTVSSTVSFTVSPINKAVFTVGGGQTIRAADTSTCSTIITFEVRNSLNEAVKMGTGQQPTSTFTLSDGGGGGAFYSNSSCTTLISNNQRTVANGSATASFYYKNTHSSVTPHTLTAAETPSQGWTDATTTIQVNPGDLDHFTFMGSDANTPLPTTRTADQSFSGTVSAYDSLNNIKFDYSGTDAKVWFSSTAGGTSYVSLPATTTSRYQFSPSDYGSKTWINEFQIKRTGTFTITLYWQAYSDELAAGSITSANITISPGDASDFVLELYPAVTPDWSKYVVADSTWDLETGAVGAPYTPKVTVKDQFGNTKTDYEGRKLWFDLFTSEGEEAYHSFTYDSEGTAYTFTAQDAGVHTFPGSAFLSSTSGRNIQFRVRNEIVHHDYAIYIKPLGLDRFSITTNESLERSGEFSDPETDKTWDQDIDSRWSGASGPASVTVTAYDVSGYIKTDYAANPDTGYGYIYFWSDERSDDDGDGNYLVNHETPYYRDRNDATDVSHCFAFPAESAGVHTFTEESEVFQWLKGGRRKIYVSECVTPSSSYVIDNDIEDPHISATWPGENLVKIGSLPATNPPDTVAVASHRVGSTHENDQHTNNADNNFTVGPGDQKLSLSWQNPFDTPATTEAKIHFYQSTNGTDFTEIVGPGYPVTANGVGTWQSREVTGLTNDQQYWFKTKVGYKRSDNTEILSGDSIVASGTPKAIAPVDVTAVQLDRNDPNHPGQVKVDFKHRFTSNVSYSYFNSTNLSWHNISTSAVSGDKGVLELNNPAGDPAWDFNNPQPRTAYIDMNLDFEGQCRGGGTSSCPGTFKIRVNVSVEGQGESNAESATMRLDTKNPANTTLVVDATNNTVANLTMNAVDDSNPILMIVSTKSDFEGAQWEAYATTKTDFDITGATHVHIKFRDLYFNDTLVSTEIRPIPASLQLKDASNITTSKYRLITIWDDAVGVDHYNIWRSTDGVNYTKIDTTTKNGYVDINLDRNITYAYQVTSEDANHNVSLPAGPVSARPGSAPDVTAEPQVELFNWHQDQGVRAKITWDTDQEADSNVAYSTAKIADGADMTAGGGAVVKINTSPDMVNAHEVWIYNLEPSTVYYFKAFSKNEIQIAGYSDVLSFTTPERVPLLVEEMKISDITMNSALVDWDSSKPATTLLEYGQTDSYGQQKTDESLNLDHTFKLDGLASGTKHYLRVKNTDADGNTTISDVYTFETPALPTISSPSISVAYHNSVTIDWTSNVNTDSNVEYYTNQKPVVESQAATQTSTATQTQVSNQPATQGKADSTTIHSVTLIGLESKTTYSYRAISKDQFGNIATSEMLSFTTASDTQAPQILNIKSEVASTGSGDAIKYQAIISWETDEPATSQIEFAMGIGGDYTESTEEILSLNSSHVVIIPDLKPNSAYHFRTASKDKSGNVGYSDDVSLITPPKEKSLLQIVIKSLEDTFSWVGRLREKWF